MLGFAVFRFSGVVTALKRVFLKDVFLRFCRMRLLSNLRQNARGMLSIQMHVFWVVSSVARGSKSIA